MIQEEKLPTAEEALQIAYDTIKANQSSEHKDVDPVLLHAIESHTAAHTAALRERVKELEAENARYREALERIVDQYEDFDPSPYKEAVLYKIAKESLKQEKMK